MATGGTPPSKYTLMAPNWKSPAFVATYSYIAGEAGTSVKTGAWMFTGTRPSAASRTSTKTAVLPISGTMSAPWLFT